MCNRSFSTHCRNSPSASFLPLISRKPGYPCDEAAGSVTLRAKTGAPIVPAARIEKTVNSFLVASILYPYRWRLEARLHWFHRNVLDLVTWLLPSIQIFSRQSSDCRYARGE